MTNKSKDKILDTPAGLLHYHVMGKGHIPLLAFHGFNQDWQVYRKLNDKITRCYQVYAFDVFYHGMSTRSVDQPLTKNLWNKAFEQFCRAESITDFETIGFSMGGKFAIASMMSRPAQCKALYGIAPDGIHHNFWYDLATFPLALQNVFKSLINQPDRLFSLISILEKSHLVDKNLSRFSRQQLATQELRQLVYLVWVNFKDLLYKQKEIANTINHYRIKPVFYLGQYDSILPAKSLTSFFSLLDAHQYFELPTGHGQLLSKALEELVI